MPSPAPVRDRTGLARPMLFAGTAAAALCLAVLMALSALRGDWPPSAVNATAHWVFGPEAARLKRVEPTVTGLGLFTHYGASLLWALVFAAAARGLRVRGAVGLFAVAMAVAGLAALVDYGLLPRRLSPGWHLVLDPPGVAAGFAAMGLGFFLGHRLAGWR